MNQSTRRKFSSRTVEAIPDVPEMYSFGHAFLQHPRGSITHNQLTGWSFLNRRLSSGLALGDTRMLTEILRTQSRSLGLGTLILISIVLGCFLFSLIKPPQTIGSHIILTDSTTQELYVRVDNRIHSVLNLASARLITGKPINPHPVKTSEIQNSPIGNLMGIPGAPNSMFQVDQKDSNWVVCDSFFGQNSGLSIISQPLFQLKNPLAHYLSDTEAFLVRFQKKNWLIWNGHRNKINLHNRWITSALGLGVDTPAPYPISLGLLDVIPEEQEIVPPFIPNFGSQTTYPLPENAPIGTIIHSTKDTITQYYIVLPDGLEPINEVIGSMITNKPNYKLKQNITLEQNQIQALPISHIIDTSRYPSHALKIIDLESQPVKCGQWSKPSHTEITQFTLITALSLPVRNTASYIQLIEKTDPKTHSPTANKVFLPSGKGYYVQIVGQESKSPLKNWLYWINDTGVRFGMDTSTYPQITQALGLINPPIAIPWSILRLFAPGPTLSRPAALVTYDSLQPTLPLNQREYKYVFPNN